MTVRGMTVRHLIAWPALVLLILMASSCSKGKDAPAAPAGGAGPDHAIERHIAYGFTLHNETGRPIEKAELWTRAPVSRTATQRCLSIRATHPYDLLVDDLGNQVLHFAFQDLPPYGTKVLNIDADLVLSDTPMPIKLEAPHHFLGSEKYIESDDPAIVRVVHALQGPKGDRAAAEAIFKWVGDNIRYAGYLGPDRGALYALNRREGDCTEFMYLFVALCRAGKVPARGLGGYVCDADCILKPNEYHNWAELHQDGTWLLADPQRKVFAQGPSRYIAMRVMANSSDEAKHPMGEFHRFRYAGEGLKVTMNQ